MSTQPIGIFDSGVGGTSIWNAIEKALPKETTIYLADSKNAPYGAKSKEEIIRLSVKNTNFLIAEGCKIIVVACNTATTNAIHYLRTQYKIPFIGIEPALKPAAIQTRTGVIGILATAGTLSSALFHTTSDQYGKAITVVEQVGEELVPLIESGKTTGPQIKALLSKYLLPMLDKHIDHLVLGCTHYPYLIPEIRTILPPHINIIDSGAAVARQTKVILTKNKLLNASDTKGRHQCYSNLDAKVLEGFLPQNNTKINVRYLDF